MRIEKKDESSAVIILDKELDRNNSEELKHMLNKLYLEGVNRINLDFSNMESIDSSAMGLLLINQKIFKERQGEVRIFNVTSKHIRNTFQMIKLDKIINIV